MLEFEALFQEFNPEDEESIQELSSIDDTYYQNLCLDICIKTNYILLSWISRKVCI